MTKQNQFLAIRPDHPLAQRFYDAVHTTQSALIEWINAAHFAGDFNLKRLFEADLQRNTEAIDAMKNQIRREHDADETCTVGLTTDGNGYPVVNGRPGGPPITLN
jgi:hypothetical protein